MTIDKSKTQAICWRLFVCLFVVSRGFAVQSVASPNGRDFMGPVDCDLNFHEQ